MRSMSIGVWSVDDVTTRYRDYEQHGCDTTEASRDKYVDS